MLVELNNDDLDIIQQLIDNVYPTIDRTNNELKFCITKGYLYHEGTNVEEQTEMLQASEEQLQMLDSLKNKLGFTDDIRAEVEGQESEIKVQ